jgi:glycerol-3-phosphate acyltransferase PlsY
MLKALVFVVIGYLSGSIPFSYLVGRLVTGKDVRREGSGNVGATNVYRVAGKRAGIAAASGDILKSFLPVLAAGWAGLDPVWVAVTGGAVILGHCYPVWLGFAGGKGVNSALAVFLVIFWPADVVFGIVWLACFRHRAPHGREEKGIGEGGTPHGRDNSLQ